MDTQFCGPNLSNFSRNPLRICCLKYRFRAFRLFLEPAFIFKNRNVRVGIISEVPLENRYVTTSSGRTSRAFAEKSAIRSEFFRNSVFIKSFRRFSSLPRTPPNFQKTWGFSGRHFGSSAQIGKFVYYPKQTEFRSRAWVMWFKIGNLFEIPLQSGLDQIVWGFCVSS